MTGEQALIKALEISKDLPEDERLFFFQMAASSSIAYLRGHLGEDVVQGFLYAASKDNITMTLDDIKNTVN